MTITPAALQAQLGTDAAGAVVLRELAPFGAAVQSWLIQGGATYPGVVKMIRTTASDNAATQATTVTTALKVGINGVG